MFLPTLVPEFGTRILFLSLAALTACALAAIFAIPRLADATPVERGARPLRMSTAARTTTVLVLLALFLFQAGNMALSAFIIRLGEHFALGRGFIGQALGWATWTGPAGAGLVIFMGTRFGPLTPARGAVPLRSEAGEGG